MRPIGSWQALVLGTALSAFVPAAGAADTCRAEVRATPGVDQTTDEALIKVFRVEASADAPCAEVTVDFVATEQLFNGEEIEVTRRGSRKVQNQAITYKADLRIARDSTLQDWEFKVAKCVPCAGR